jgi:hypothetical protein
MRLYTNSGYYSPRGTRGRLSGGIAGVGQTCSWINQGTAAEPSYFWGAQLANGSIESCPSGGPPTAAPTSTSNTAGQNIINEETDYADTPYLNSPAYLAAESADVGGAVGSDAANALSTLQTYCQLNVQNNQLFGDPLDTATCAGVVPLPTYTQQANALTSVVPTTVSQPAATTTSNALNKSATQVNSTPTGGAANQSNQTANTNTNINGSQSTSNTTTTATCNGITGGNLGPCIGPLDAGTWGLIAAGVVVLLMVANKG